MSDDVEEVTSPLMQNPIHISVTEEKLFFNSIPPPYIWAVNDEGRLHTLVELYMKSTKTCSRFVIFTRDTPSVELLRKSLTARRFAFSSMDDSVDKEKRKKNMKKFNSGKCRLLITTDCSDCQLKRLNMTHLINFSRRMERNILSDFQPITKWTKPVVNIKFLL
ncbi:ATP-dependent RNA helicase RhlB-like [Artemia franciscana]|uniref:ATP-dependent RNA helicase RhlB-like n=1 Tax=Artemia franciscana TaxID=6661 RepID=UPI0032DB0D82